MKKPCDPSKLNNLKKFMRYKGAEPFNVFIINGAYIVGIYKGDRSDSDIIVRYRQKTKSCWSVIRTPNIHWVVDILMKIQALKMINRLEIQALKRINRLKLVKNFLDFLLSELKKFMRYKGAEPFNVSIINGAYIVGIYKGNLSDFDIIVRYRQKTKSCWSAIRTPKHIHWVVDILMKIQALKMINQLKLVENFLDFLLSEWENTKPIKSECDRIRMTKIKQILSEYSQQIAKYSQLSKYGEYPIEFLLVLAKLLMIQEKTNRKDAHMFKKLLEALKNGEDIFKIVSIASHTGR